MIKPDGSTVAGVKISFTLVDATTHNPITAATATKQRVNGMIQVTTDANGEFSIALIPNDQLSPATVYLCHSHGIGESFYATLESGVDPKQWNDFFLQASP